MLNAPVFTTAQVKRKLKGSTLTVSRLISLFKESNIIEEFPFRAGRAKIYAFRGLLKLLS
jgi:hypothetical protein